MGSFTTYLCIVMMLLAFPIGLIVIWPLTLLTELFVNARRTEIKKKEAMGAAMPQDMADQLRSELEMLRANRKMIDDVIAEHAKKLAETSEKKS